MTSSNKEGTFCSWTKEAFDTAYLKALCVKSWTCTLKIACSVSTTESVNQCQQLVQRSIFFFLIPLMYFTARHFSKQSKGQVKCRCNSNLETVIRHGLHWLHYFVIYGEATSLTRRLIQGLETGCKNSVNKTWIANWKFVPLWYLGNEVAMVSWNVLIHMT